MQACWNEWRKVSDAMCHKRLCARLKEKVYTTMVRPQIVYGDSGTEEMTGEQSRRQQRVNILI